MAALEVRPVQGRRDLTAFIKLPFRLHRGTPWVPPLITERRRFLDRDKNPFFEHAEAEYFLCERDGALVGRISAHVDERWTRFQGGNDGMFGFFESENDPEVARALVDAATRVGAHPRARSPARPDGLHHQRRVRPAGRGPRPRAADPRALASALLPGAARGARHDQGHGPLDVAPGDGGAEAGRPFPRLHPPGGAGGGRGARRGHPPDEKARPGDRDRPLHGRLQRGLGDQLGLRADHRGGGSLPVQEPEADPGRELGDDRRARRRGGGRGADAAGRQPGAGEDERPAAAARLVALPDRPAARSTGFGSSRSASSPATSTWASPPPCTCVTSRRLHESASSGARWAGSSRSTSR